MEKLWVLRRGSSYAVRADAPLSHVSPAPRGIGCLRVPATRWDVAGVRTVYQGIDSLSAVTTTVFTLSSVHDNVHGEKGESTMHELP
jgi:hypothetical protein